MMMMMMLSVDGHHQPVLLSLAIMNYHEDDEDVDDYHQHEHDAEQF